ncbi:unnamed protein product [Protopolystoma xenopodis]|uniref:C2H2-type domain-containing protein n=1 Tax=Protopolystoma xenopodis TaxID=117903 RepID=A0A3S5AYH1_9PLAT|nr:unnamed protein product [Protopolystoma xenopodis]
MQHKQDGSCSRVSSAHSSFSCYYCQESFLTPLLLIQHVEWVHRINLMKSSGKEVKSHLVDEHSIFNTIEAKTTSSITNELKSAVGVFSMASSFEGEKQSFEEGQMELHQENIFSSTQDTGTVREAVCISYKRKTCCMEDGGEPCEQITSCPILFPEETASDSEELAQRICPKESYITEENKTLYKEETQSSDKVRNFTCIHCSKRYFQNIHLRKHIMNAHTGEKPFACSMCDYRTVEKSHLTVHLRRHTKERPFRCHICDYKASQNSTLKIHCQRKHNGQFLSCCCNKRFYTQKDIEKHLKKYSCDKLKI